MQILHSLDSAALPRRGCALAVGNFDGIHLGHRRIIRRLLREAAARNLPAFLLTFAPHPEKIFGPDRILMIQTLAQRLAAISKLGLETAAVIPFTRDFARTTAESFADRILAGVFKARVVVVGSNFHFGRDRLGDPCFLKSRGPALGFETVIVRPRLVEGSAVSSSLIRALLIAGDVGQAALLLGRGYEIEGTVIRGEGRGRSLGFPTANIETPNEIKPPGVFATRLFFDGMAHPSVTNIGLRPTFAGTIPTIETHILGPSPDINGASVRLSFVRRLREERPFESAGRLVAQIRKDVAEARRVFGL